MKVNTVKKTKSDKSEPIFISVTDQFIIDAIRTIRYNLGITQDELSDGIRVKHLVGNAESAASPHKYSDYHLQDIVSVFNTKAKEINQAFIAKDSTDRVKDDYTVFDLYPPSRLVDELVLKSINVVSDKIYPTGAVNIIIDESGFLAVPRTTKQVTDFANSRFSKTWVTSEIGQALDRATTRDLLLKTDPPGVTYVIKKDK